MYLAHNKFHCFYKTHINCAGKSRDHATRSRNLDASFLATINNSHPNRCKVPKCQKIHSDRSATLASTQFIMTTEDIEASQSAGDELGVGGPGAPTPLSALEVGIIVIS
jgi:hypothetical protein